MRVPQAHLFQRYARYIVFFILGMVTGAVIFVYIYGETMDRILWENRHLISKNNALQDEIEALEEDNDALNKQNQQTPVVKRIQIDIEKNPDDTDEFIDTEVADLLREDIKFLINMPLESIAETADALYNLIDDKTYEIEQQEIDVEVHSIIIYSTLTIKVSLHKVR